MQNSTYRGLTFPPYKYQEYPKVVRGVVVKNKAEEDEAVALAELEDADNAHRSNAPHTKRSNPLRS
jgi:hypothetical protein